MKTSSEILAKYPNYKKRAYYFEHVVKAMEEYHQERMREELIKFAEWYYCEQGGIDDFTVKYIDEYLKKDVKEK